MPEQKRRSIAKTISFRILATLLTILIVFGLTGKWQLSLGAGFIDLIAKLLLYYYHERVWNKISYGRTIRKKR